MPDIDPILDSDAPANPDPASLAESNNTTSEVPELNELYRIYGESAVAMGHANRALAVPYPRSALDMYTRILKSNPGYMPAFLNRSMCYLLLDYPQLAVVDAYRAILAAEHCLANNPDKIKGAENLMRYYNYAVDADPDDEAWVTKTGQYIAEGSYKLLDGDLASLFIPTDEGRETPESLTQQMEINRYHLLHDVRIKAHYRLALGLWKCGGGALQTALDQINLIVNAPQLSKGDLKQFRTLQNRILCDIEELFRQEKSMEYSMKQRNLSLDTDGVRQLLRIRQTKVKRETFPWDKRGQESLLEPTTLDDFNSHLSLGKYPVRYHLHTPMSSSVPSIVVFKACQRIKVGIRIFHERSTIRAVVPCQDNRKYCKTCGASLKFEGDAKTKDKGRVSISSVGIEEGSPPTLVETKPADDLTMTSGESNTIGDNGSQSDIKDFSTPTETAQSEVTYSSRQVEEELPLTRVELQKTDGTSSAQRDKDEPLHHYQLCPVCNKAAFCSEECHGLGSRDGSHKRLCGLVFGFHNFTRADDTLLWLAPSPWYSHLLCQLVLGLLAVSNDAGLYQAPLEILDGDMSKSPVTYDEWQKYEHETPELAIITTRMRWELHPNRHLNLLFPNRFTYERNAPEGVLTETDAPSTESPYSVDWDFHSSVRLPLRHLYEMHAKVSEGNGLKAMLSLTYDGWVLETLRMKLAAHMRIRPYPSTTKAFNPSGQLISTEHADDADLDHSAHHRLNMTMTEEAEGQSTDSTRP